MLVFEMMRDAHKQLKTPQMAKLTPLAKLIWLYIAIEGQDEYSARKLEVQLGVSYLAAYNSMTILLAKNLLLEVVPAAGSRGAILRALEPE